MVTMRFSIHCTRFIVNLRILAKHCWFMVLFPHIWQDECCIGVLPPLNGDLSVEWLNLILLERALTTVSRSLHARAVFAVFAVVALRGPCTLEPSLRVSGALKSNDVIKISGWRMAPETEPTRA